MPTQTTERHDQLVAATRKVLSGTCDRDCSECAKPFKDYNQKRAMAMRERIYVDVDGSWRQDDGKAHEVRCPECDGHMTLINAWPRFCPFCGVELGLEPGESSPLTEYLDGINFAPIPAEPESATKNAE